MTAVITCHIFYAAWLVDLSACRALLYLRCSGQWPKPLESLMAGSTMRQFARTSGTAGTLGEEGVQGRRATNKQIAVDSRSGLLFWYVHHSSSISCFFCDISTMHD